MADNPKKHNKDVAYINAATGLTLLYSLNYFFTKSWFGLILRKDIEVVIIYTIRWSKYNWARFFNIVFLLLLWLRRFISVCLKCACCVPTTFSFKCKEEERWIFSSSLNKSCGTPWGCIQVKDAAGIELSTT